MRALAFRSFRILVLAFVAYIAIAWARQSERPWLGYAVAALLLGIWMGAFVLDQRRRRTQGREARWDAALYDARQRGRAIREVRRALRKLGAVTRKKRSEHTRLSIMLAELLDAEGEYADAMAAVDAIEIATLTALDEGLVRHTRAVTHLRGSDAAGALAALQDRKPSGDSELDLRLNLLEAYALVECGEAPRALEIATHIENGKGVDESVLTEARVVRAAALDAEGRREEALVVLAALGRDALVPLSELGQPRMRELSKLVLDGSSA